VPNTSSLLQVEGSQNIQDRALTYHFALSNLAFWRTVTGNFFGQTVAIWGACPDKSCGVGVCAMWRTVVHHSMCVACGVCFVTIIHTPALILSGIQLHVCRHQAYISRGRYGTCNEKCFSVSPRLKCVSFKALLCRWPSMTSKPHVAS
jgi:hypothetical protein